MLWQGACEISNSTYGGMPKAYYEYRYEVSNRTTTSVHLKLEVGVRMLNPWNYYSFGLAHSCKVGVGTREEVLANAPITKTYLKTDRKWWGHSNEWVQSRATYNDTSDYDGQKWHWFTVYDMDVPIEPTATGLTVIPCIWQQSICTQTPYNPSNPWAIDPEETCNWLGWKGVWIPFEYDTYNGYPAGYYANREVGYNGYGCGTFLNNKGYQVLQFDGDTIPIPPYPYTKAPLIVFLSPVAIDEEQKGVPVRVTWSEVDDAAAYLVIIHNGGKAVERRVNVTSFEFYPASMFALDSLHGQSFYAEVFAIDQNGAQSLNSTVSNELEYIEHLAPNAPLNVTLLPVAVDVASGANLTCTWNVPAPVGNVPNATGAVYYDVRIESEGVSSIIGTSETKLSINPRNVKIEPRDGRVVTFSVRSVDEYGYVSEWAQSNEITFTEAPTYAADTFTLVGMRGTENEVLFTGETCSVNLLGEIQGSFPIASRRLVRLSDGFFSEVGTDYQVKVKGVLKPATTALMQLQCFDANGMPVYNRNGEWPIVDVLYYGGLVYVYDNGWKLGWLYVYADGWKEAMGANIYDGGWR